MGRQAQRREPRGSERFYYLEPHYSSANPNPHTADCNACSAHKYPPAGTDEYTHTGTNFNASSRTYCYPDCRAYCDSNSCPR